jgi:hypothetical protein
MADDPTHPQASSPTNKDTSGKQAYYYISLAIPQAGHFLASACISARALDDASAL